MIDCLVFAWGAAQARCSTMADDDFAMATKDPFYYSLLGHRTSPAHHSTDRGIATLDGCTNSGHRGRSTRKTRAQQRLSDF